jgi:putative hydrolase of HD superfamily
MPRGMPIASYKLHDFTQPLSISDHMYRMAVLALCSEDSNLDIGKCALLAIVHDLAEAQGTSTRCLEGITEIPTSLQWAT